MLFAASSFFIHESAAHLHHHLSHHVSDPVDDGFLILVKPLQDLGAEYVTITRDPISRTKIKLEWDSPFRDENQIVDVLCSGKFVAVGNHEKVLLLGKNDASIQALRNQTIRFNGAESDINTTQVAPKIWFVIPLPAKVHAQPSAWMCSNSNGKQVRMEGAVSLQELVTAQNGQIGKVDAGMMWIFFKREDAGENKLFRFSPPRLRQYANAGAINYNHQQPPQQSFYYAGQPPVANQPPQQPQPFPFYGHQPPAANQPQPPAQPQHQDIQEQFQDMTRQLNHMAMMLEQQRQQQQQQQQQYGTPQHQQPPTVVRVEEASMSMGVSTQRSTDTTASLGEDEDEGSMYRDL